MIIINKFILEQLHNSGRLPDKFYYQETDLPYYLSFQYQKQRILENFQLNSSYNNLENVLQKDVEEIIDSLIDRLNK